MFSVCVFCASSPKVDARYIDAAHEAGIMIAEHGWRLVYGGGQNGLMGAAADGALAAGGEVTGVIPQSLVEKEVAHAGLTTLYKTDTMHERQMKMTELSDAFVVLPGGTGTLAELFEVITWRQLGLHEKPIILVNIDGYWDSLIAMMDHATQEQFLYGDYRKTLRIIEDLGDLSTILKKTLA